MFSPANLLTFTVFYLVEGTYIIYVHNTCIVSSLGMGGCSIRDYLERMKQLVQFYGQVDEMYNQKAIHVLKSKLSAEVRVIVRCFLYILFSYRIWNLVDLLTSRWLEI